MTQELGANQAESTRQIPRKLLVVMTSIAVVATALMAPVSPANAAETDNSTAVTKSADDGAVGATVPDARAANADKTRCSIFGASAKGDRDCLTMRIRGRDSKTVGQKVKVTGKLRQKALANTIGTRGTNRVVVERSKDGGRWTDDERRWKKVASTKVRKNGRYKARVKLKNRGLHTCEFRLSRDLLMSRCPSHGRR